MPDEAQIPASRPSIARALGKAALTALVAFGLFLPLIGFRTFQNIRNELTLETRWPLLFVFVAIPAIVHFAWEIMPRNRVQAAMAAFFRSARKLAVAAALFAALAALAYGLVRFVLPGGHLRHPELVVLVIVSNVLGIACAIGSTVAWILARYPADTDAGRHRRDQIGSVLRIGALGFLVAYPIMMLQIAGFQGAIKWIDNFGIQILIYVMLGWGLNIVVGLAGLLDLGYVAFYAVGAYSYALLAKSFGLSFWLLLPLAGILAAFWGILLGFPVLRLRGDYLAIVTLAFGEIIRLVLINWVALTNGYAGISSIPPLTFFGIEFSAEDNGFASRFGLQFSPIYSTIFLYYVILGLALLTAAVTIRLRRLPLGRAWEALREDEIACRSLGINTTTTKLSAFAIGAMFGGFAGSFFAARQGFISPESFTFMESAVIVAIVVLGGMGSQIGVAIAAVLMVGATELMRELDVLKEIFGREFDPAQYRMLLFGLAMVLIMIWKPRGLVSTRHPSVYLKERKAVSGTLVREGRA